MNDKTKHSDEAQEAWREAIDEPNQQNQTLFRMVELLLDKRDEKPIPVGPDSVFEFHQDVVGIPCWRYRCSFCGGAVSGEGHGVSVMCNCGHATTVYRDRTVCVDHNPDPFTERRDT